MAYHPNRLVDFVSVSRLPRRSAAPTIVLLSVLAAGCGDATAPVDVPVHFSHAAGAETVWGPVTVVRDAGSPTEFTTTITGIDFAAYGPPFVMHVEVPEDAAPTHAAEVWLDGRQIFGTWRFSGAGFSLTRTVTVTNGSELLVILRGAPGAALTVWIEGTPLD